MKKLFYILALISAAQGMQIRCSEKQLKPSEAAIKQAVQDLQTTVELKRADLEALQLRLSRLESTDFFKKRRTIKDIAIAESELERAIRYRDICS